jgi:hypothetical protein
MTKKTRNWLIAAFILALPFVLFLGFFIFMEEPRPPLPPLPHPNGYEDLVKAGGMLSPAAGNYNENDLAQLKKVVSSDAVALSLARAGLSNQCRVPVQYSLSYISNHLNDLTAMKRLAQAFTAEGRLAELEHRPADAAKSYLDLIHLAHESTRGGLLIDELVGMAIQGVGTSHLQTLAPQLDAQACRETAAALAALDSQGQTWNEVMQQESDWSHGMFRGWRDELARWETRKSMKKMDRQMERKFATQQAGTRQLIISLAARAYELDKGHPPASATDLVPDYLKAIPQDPTTGTNVVYAPR